MADLKHITTQLEHSLSHPSAKSTALLSQAKLALLHQDALLPTSSTPAHLLQSAQHILELGALISIRLQDPAAFTRYFQQLQPFYSASDAGRAHHSHTSSSHSSQRSKITGLYLLLLLSQGDYAGFHTLLEMLEVGGGNGGKALEEDEFIRYPMQLEQWLMEGSYDRVWHETKSERVPSEEFAIFSDILTQTIRTEIATCAAKAYPSIPVANAKSLFFLDSEGSVVSFSNSKGWTAKDGRVYFPETEGFEGEGEEGPLGARGTGNVIENALGYARELEMIV